MTTGTVTAYSTVSREMTNVTASNDTLNLTDFLDYDYEIDLWDLYLKPTPAQWFVFSLFAVVFVISVIGNGLSK